MLYAWSNSLSTLSKDSIYFKKVKVCTISVTNNEIRLMEYCICCLKVKLTMHSQLLFFFILKQGIHILKICALQRKFDSNVISQTEDKFLERGKIDLKYNKHIGCWRTLEVND